MNQLFFVPRLNFINLIKQIHLYYRLCTPKAALQFGHHICSLHEERQAIETPTAAQLYTSQDVFYVHWRQAI
jgi:hypothetical protein